MWFIVLFSGVWLYLYLFSALGFLVRLLFRLLLCGCSVGLCFGFWASSRFVLLPLVVWDLFRLGVLGIVVFSSFWLVFDILASLRGGSLFFCVVGVIVLFLVFLYSLLFFVSDFLVGFRVFCVLVDFWFLGFAFWFLCFMF